jgi:hypothetical protein
MLQGIFHVTRSMSSGFYTIKEEVSMETGLLITALVFFFIGIGLVVSGSKQLKKSSFLKQATMQSIGSLKTGPVKIKGRIVASETLSSPYSKTPCVYYRYRIVSTRFKSTTGGPGSATAASQQVAGGENSLPFDIDDGTGRIHIDAENAEVQGLEKINYYVSASNETMTLKERVERLKEMGESDFKKAHTPIHIPQDLIPYESPVHRSQYDYLFGDAYIQPDSEVVVVGVADKLADNRMTIRKKPIMLVASEEALAKSRLSNSNTLLFLVIGAAMMVLGIALSIVAIWPAVS